ncbi:MAG: CRISPR-associated endoribonuclease Cas6 [Nitrospinota bacterium]|jgi:CRISPR-associated endoribonuclease Cas6
MRIKITLSSDKPGTINFNYQHQIQGIIYQFLAMSDPDYSAWLHKQGFVYRGDKNFKLFVFSGITFHSPIKIADGFAFKGTPSNLFNLSFQIASPVNQFIQHLIDGIFKEGQEIKLGRQCLNVHRVETLPEYRIQNSEDRRQNICGSDIGGFPPDSCILTPEFLIFKPLESPIFIKKPMPKGERDIYLFPGDKNYEEFLNQNLIHKFETLYGKPYEGETLKFDFQFEQLERFNRLKRFKPVKSFKVYKNGIVADEIKGTLQPFTVTGSKELIKIGLDCGFGQNNSMGCGYVEPAQIS